MQKRTVQLLLIEGDAYGPIQAKLDNWTGVAYRLPRLGIEKNKERSDLNHCGVYFLFGHDENTDDPMVYIGQVQERKNGGALMSRFSEHDKNKSKDFCSEIVFFTTLTNDFGPTELCYLENKFWHLAVEAGQYRVNNGNEPSMGHVTEAKQAELDRFIENAKILMKTFGHKVFSPKNPIEKNADEEARPTVRLHLRHTIKKGRADLLTVRADAVMTTDGFTVLKNSNILLQNKPELTMYSKGLIQRLLEENKLEKVQDIKYRLLENQSFNTPSGAGAFVIGSTCNGLEKWRTQDGTTLKELLSNM